MTVTLTCASGFQLDTLTVKDSETGSVVPVSGSGDTRTFTMPGSDADVYATFAPLPGRFPLFVGERQVSESNKDDVFGDGTVKFVPASAGADAELILDGYTYSGTGYQFDMEKNGWAAIYYGGSEKLTITLKGSSSVEINWPAAREAWDPYMTGLYSYGNTTVRGTGSLELKAGDSPAKMSDCYGAHFTYLTVESGTLTARTGRMENSLGSSYGIYCRTFIIRGGEVNGYGGTANWTHGVYCSGTLYVTGGTVRGYGGDATEYEGRSRSRGVTVLDLLTVSGGAVYGYGGKGVFSCGVYSDEGISLRSKESAVIGYGGEASEGTSCGIFAKEDVAVSDGATLMGFAGGARNFSCGIYLNHHVNSQGAVPEESEADLTVKGGSVIAVGGRASSGDSCGVWCRNITVEGGGFSAVGQEAPGSSCGVRTDGSLSVCGGKLDAKSYVYGIFAGKGAEVSGGEVTAEAFDTSGDTSCGIYCPGGELAVTAGNVTASGGKSSGSSSGVFCAGYDGAGKLKAVATAPRGSVLAAARYNSSGALEEVRLTEIDDFCSARTFDTGIRRREGCTCTVMLVSKAKFIPLCQAAEV